VRARGGIRNNAARTKETAFPFEIRMFVSPQTFSLTIQVLGIWTLLCTLVGSFSGNHPENYS
ncbi:MAG: hypothetical protein ACMUHM_06705, partial [Thermoplasmatota archaeon]